ncbi:MAG: hypothetical protein AAB407_02300 [Patescibacteria group bacterium]
MDPKEMHAKIMRRVYGVWFLRSTAPLLVIEIIFFIILFGLIADRIFVEHVVKNTILASYGNPFRSLAYLTASFVRTSFAIKTVLVLIASCLVLTLRDINRSIITYIAIRRRNVLGE